MPRIDVGGILTSHESIEAVFPKEVWRDGGMETTYCIRFKSGKENEISEEDYKAIRANWVI